MKIDTKYFIPFVFTAAVASAIIIGYFTIQVRQERRQTFRKRLTSQDSIEYAMMPIYFGSDSLSVQSFEDSFVVLDFWATWTAVFSKTAQKQLAKLKRMYPQKLEVIVAVVQDKPKKVRSFLKRHNYPFHYVKGTKVFEEYSLPGVPIQLVYSPEGELVSIFTGRAEPARLDSLKEIITDG